MFFEPQPTAKQTQETDGFLLAAVLAREELSSTFGPWVILDEEIEKESPEC